MSEQTVTAVDVDALDAVHVVDRWGDECQGCRTNCLYCEGDHPWPCDVVALLAEVRRGRALREAVEGLAEQWLASSVLGLSTLSGAGRELRRTLAATDGTP